MPSDREIRLETICKLYDGEPVLQNLSLRIPSGEFFALLGPSGSGKTTILRLIGGFESPDSGEIFIGSKNITQVPAHERHVNTVFQHYALFPHLNVFDNIAYPLTIRGCTSTEIKRRVHRVIEKVRLERYMYKPVTVLSGGQQQRVALARAVVSEPDVLLLDEPLAALDFKLREQMLIELIELQSELGTTFVYVTHDQFEALTVADTMAIMNPDGAIEQMGAPEEIYEFPRSSYVARFVGSTNLIRGGLRGTAGNYSIYNELLGDIAAPNALAQGVKVGDEVILSLRPEKITITKKERESFSNTLSGVVESIVYHGRSTQYNVRVYDQIIQVFEQNREHFDSEAIDYDDQVFLHWQKNSAVMLKH